MTDFLKSVLVSGLLIGGTAGACLADVLAVATRTDPVAGTNTAFAPIPLTNNNNQKTLTFTTTAPNEVVVLTYNAECVRNGAAGWVSVAILVDAVQASPNSLTNFAMCVGTESGAVRQSVFTVPTPGTHTAQVRATAAGGATGYSLDDTSFVIQD